MPVHFKSTSEYSRKFGSSLTDSAPAGVSAGIESENIATTCEPPLQSKKRLEGPVTSLSTTYFGAPSKEVEYALLGNTDKFAENVRYKPKPNFSNGKIYKNKENFDDAPPPSKQLKMQKRIKPLIKERHPPVRQESSTSMQLSPPPAPRALTHVDVEVKAAHKDKDLKDVLGEPKQQSAPQKVVSMNEFVQTNMKKGVTLSGAEAPADYSLKYKAGVAPPRPVKKLSEYSRQFQWKDGAKASPLLAAEQIVYTSQADLGPYKTNAIPKASEYQMQFQKWKLPDYTNEVNLQLAAKKSSENLPEKKKITIKRSKSVGASLHEPGQGQVTESSSEELLKAKLIKSHGKIKRLGSEYKANFKAPLSYSYGEGAWKGAAPPQMTPDLGQADLNANNNADDANNNAEPLSNWFAEVVELRRRAQEYRKRAQGTHFSREHLVQLMAKQNNVWDISSNASSTVRALNLEIPAAGLVTPIKKLSVASSPEPMESVSMEEGDASPGEEADDIEVTEARKTAKKSSKRGGKSRHSRKMAWMEEQKEKVADQRRNLELQCQREAEAADEESLAEVEGRLPTPVLRGDNSARRHHLDLTTPAIGGALLTAPPTGNSKIIMTSRSGDSYVTMSDDVPVLKPQKSYDMEKLITMATSGKPSLDTHLLRDDDAESDRPLVTQYINAHAPAVDEDKENKSKPKIRKSKKPTNLSTIKEGQGKTYLNIEDIRAQTGKGNQQDDDVMSVSLMSVASSGSLASEVLERAKQRSKFWSQKS